MVHVERLSLMAEGSEEAVFRVDAGSCPDTGEKAGQSRTKVILLTTLGVSHRLLLQQKVTRI